MPLLAANIQWPQNRRGERLVFVAQLRREDFPFLRFPSNTGWVQLYWDRRFPFDPESEAHEVEDGDAHEDRISAWWTGLMPKPHILWLPAMAAGEGVRPDPPDYLLDSPLVPLPCACDLEPLTDHPHRHDLYRLRAGSVDPEDVHSYEEVATGQGTKVGGWPFWLQGDDTPRCGCGRAMDLLLTVASSEYLSRNGSRWDYVGPDAEPVKRDYNPTNRIGIEIHDTGHAYFFYCLNCPGLPMRWVHQNF